jgi:hypothetical protein
MKIAPSSHAVARYQERIRPGLDTDAARVDLERLIREHGIIVERPDWYTEARERASKASHWVQLGPDVLMPCMERRDGVLMGLTVVHNHGLSAEARAKRNRSRRRHRFKPRASSYERERFGRQDEAA